MIAKSTENMLNLIENAFFFAGFCQNSLLNVRLGDEARLKPF